MAYFADSLMSRENARLTPTSATAAAAAPGKRRIPFVSFGADMMYIAYITASMSKNRITNLTGFHSARVSSRLKLRRMIRMNHSPVTTIRPDTYMTARKPTDSAKLKRRAAAPPKRPPPCISPIIPIIVLNAAAEVVIMTTIPTANVGAERSPPTYRRKSPITAMAPSGTTSPSPLIRLSCVILRLPIIALQQMSSGNADKKR